MQYEISNKQYVRKLKPITYHLLPISSPAGFTLIEILTVVVILAIVAAIGTNMFFTILRGSTKTRVLAEVKQNGGYALNVLERTIRNAKGLSGGGSSITIINPDDTTTIFSCQDINGDGINEILLDGASLTSDKVNVQGCSIFTVTEGEAGIRPDMVTIDFTLSQAGIVTRPEEEAVINFKTTVILRNY